MCGLSGLAGTIGLSDKKYVEEMLIFNIPRGRDSTGLAAISRNDKDPVKMAKAMGTPFGDAFGEVGLFGYKSYERAMTHAGKAIISHNRAATRGACTIHNQHPFWFPKVIGAHNGTLEVSSHKDLLGYGVHGTDSECLYNNINEKGLEATISEIRGAWALTWYNFEDGTINLLRNKERALHYIVSASKKTLYWSSDYEPMMYALARAKINVGENKPAIVPEDMWLSWKIPEAGQDFGEPTRTTVKGKADPFPVRTQEAYGGRSTLTTNSGGCHGSNWPTSKPSGVTLLPFMKGAVEDMMYDKATATWVPAIKKNVVIENGVTVHSDNPSTRKLMLQRVSKIRDERFVRQHGTPGTALILKHHDFQNKIYFNKLSEDWWWYNYEVANNEWKIYKSDDPPHALPFTLINVEAGGNHNFAYKKVRKVRCIYYKGYEGNLLPPDRFNRLMEDGCINCQRKPTWGNVVRFLNHDTFLCEHCTEMPNVARWMGIGVETALK